MNRSEFQKLARVRLREAEALLAARLYDGAYYLAGYAVECGLKACIARLTRRHDFPDRDFVRGAYTHEYANLIKTAKLEDRHRSALAEDPGLEANWRLVKQWNENSRYARWARAEAFAIVAAVNEPHHGVLSWIERQW